MRAGRTVSRGAAEAERIVRGDGTHVVRNREPLGRYPERITDRLDHWAAATPDEIFLAERDGDGWRTISYGETLPAVRSVAQALVARGLGAERGVAILSDNGIDHALVGLAAQYAGIPYAPISPSYSLVSKDYAKLRDVLGTFAPGLVFVDDGARYAGALEAAVPPHVAVVASRGADARAGGIPLAGLFATEPGPELERAHAAVNADTIAKVLFTSGTTGSPKGVTCAQRMLCSNATMIAKMYPPRERPVILDWLPWNHTFGGNHNFNLVLSHGGTIYINDGKPTPALGERTRRNLRDVAPTIYFDVPKGYEMLVGFLREDDALRERFFSRLSLMMYSGAGLSRHLWDDIQRLSRETTGRPILMVTSLGSTETGPMAIAAPHLADGPGYIGIPVPGVDLKLVPNGSKLELRLRGPNVTQGYLRAPELTANAFDDEGFYKIGDAIRYVDPDDPSEGFLFDGRISEDFKLDTGTWVSVGPLRQRALSHFAPLLLDGVISGENRAQLALLAFPDLARCRTLAADVAPDAPAADVLASPLVRAAFANLLAGLAATSTGSSTRIDRLVLLAEPPSLDAGEITDKGSLNARAIFARRASAVEAAHAAAPPADVIAL